MPRCVWAVVRVILWHVFVGRPGVYSPFVRARYKEASQLVFTCTELKNFAAVSGHAHTHLNHMYIHTPFSGFDTLMDST